MGRASAVTDRVIKALELRPAFDSCASSTTRETLHRYFGGAEKLHAIEGCKDNDDKGQTPSRRKHDPREQIGTDTNWRPRSIPKTEIARLTL